jgi:hypothetical protein
MLEIGKSMSVEAMHLDTEIYDQNELAGQLSS